MAASDRLELGRTAAGRRFTLPLAAATVTATIVARRGAGKTNTATVLVEELVRAQVQVAVLDPVGVWWGLRAAAGGERPGLPVVVLGGEHGDLPLLPEAGAAVAELLVEEGLSAVLDLSGFESEAQKCRFVGEFTDRLYRLKAREEYRTPLHLVLEEAEEFAPQAPLPGEQRMLGSVVRLVKRGRSRGLAATLITQRPASLNKNVMSQSEILVILALASPHDRRAVDEWIRAYGGEAQREEVLGSVAALPTGTAYVWWPAAGVFERVEIRRRRTFDASSTPQPGEARRAPKRLAAVDLTRLRARLAAAQERGGGGGPAPDARRRGAAPAVERVEVPVLPPETAAALGQAARELAAVADRLAALAGSVAAEARAVVTALDRVAPERRVGPEAGRTAAAKAARPQFPDEGPPGAPNLLRAERRILTVLARYHQGRTKRQLAILAGYAASGGGFNNALSRLRGAGLLEGGPEWYRITEAGLGALGSWEPLPTGRALLEYWLGQLPRAERLILEVLADAYPAALPKEEVAERTGYAPSGGGFNNALSRLRTLELIAGRGELRASDALFEEGGP